MVGGATVFVGGVIVNKLRGRARAINNTTLMIRIAATTRINLLIGSAGIVIILPLHPIIICMNNQRTTSPLKIGLNVIQWFASSICHMTILYIKHVSHDDGLHQACVT